MNFNVLEKVVCLKNSFVAACCSLVSHRLTRYVKKRPSRVTHCLTETKLLIQLFSMFYSVLAGTGNKMG